MNQIRSGAATAVTAVALASPIVALVYATFRLMAAGAFDTINTTATLAQFWVVVALVIGLAVLARLMGQSLADVRSRGLGPVPAVSPVRSGALALAERSYFAAGPGPEAAEEAPTMGRLGLWLAPIRTPEFVEVEETETADVGDLAADKRAVAMAMVMMPAEEAKVAAYDGAVETITASRGDTWWTLATDTLDDGERWAEIAALNVDRVQHDGVVMTEETRIRPGYELIVPERTEDEEA